MEKLFYNGTILTMESGGDAPEAVLLRDGRIQFVGALQEARVQAAPDAEWVDLQGHCLMPGFIDAHSHAVMAGQMAMCADLSECTCFAEIANTLKQYIAEHALEPGQVVLGFGYDHNFLREKEHPGKALLDQVSTEQPIIILHVSGHMGCANSKALELAGITAATEIPGGMIRLNEAGEPDGYLEEAANIYLQTSLADRIKMDMESIAREMQKVYLQHGVTTVQDGATAAETMELLKMMADRQLLTLDVVAYPMIMSGGAKVLADNPERDGKYVKHVKLGGYKLILDGSPQGRSAWMSEPYCGEEADYCGYPWMTDEDVEEAVRQAVAQKRQLLAHCNGDAASEQLLNAYEKAVKEFGKADLRPVMIHCQTVRTDQLERMKKLDMIASIFVGHVYFWGDVHCENLGERRANRISPVREATELGVMVNFHQDTPVTKPDMLHSVWCAVNRLTRDGKVLGSDQRVSVYEALKAVTINAAYEYFEEEEKGSIREGKRADLVILGENPLTCDPMKLREIQVLETIKDGVSCWTR